MKLTVMEKGTERDNELQELEQLRTAIAQQIEQYYDPAVLRYVLDVLEDPAKIPGWGELELTSAQQAELDRRTEMALKGEGTYYSWEEVKAELRASRKAIRDGRA